MTTWQVTRKWLVEADTFDEAATATEGVATTDVTGKVIGHPTGTMAGYMARHLEERAQYWRNAVGDEAWERALAYWRERIEADPGGEQ